MAKLPAPELLEDVRKAFQDDLTDGGLGDLELIEVELLHPELSKRKAFTLITDALDEMEGWACFRLEGDRLGLPPSSPPPPLPPRMVATPSLSARPGVTTPYRRVEKIGRNDPCPCGSGKKYKKCRGAN